MRAVVVCALVLIGSGPVAGWQDVSASSPVAVHEYWNPVVGWSSLPDAPQDPPEMVWQVELGAGDSYEIRAGVVVVAEPSSASVTVQRIDAATGSASWSVELEGSGEPWLQLDGSGSLVSVQLESPDAPYRTAVIDVDDGHIVWHGEMPDLTVWADPLDDIVVVTDVVTSFGVDASSGTELWRIDGEVVVRDGQLILVGSGSLPLDETDNIFGVLDAERGELQWQQPRPNYADPHVVGDTVILTRDEDRRTDSVTAYEPATGRQRWRADAPSIGRAGAWPVGDDAVLVFGNGDSDATDSAAALDLATGSTLWTSSLPPSGQLIVTLRVGDNQFMVARSPTDMWLLDPATGETIDDAEIGFGESAPVIAAGVVYFHDVHIDEVVAIDMSSLDERWTTPLGREWRIRTAVTGGFVASITSDDGTRIIAGFVGT